MPPEQSVVFCVYLAQSSRCFAGRLIHIDQVDGGFPTYADVVDKHVVDEAHPTQ